MVLEEIQNAVIQILEEVQRISGRKAQQIPLSLRPVLDLEGFDSLCSVEATVLLEEKLGSGELDKGSIFLSEDGLTALSILETSRRIQKLLAAKGEKA